MYGRYLLGQFCKPIIRRKEDWPRVNIFREVKSTKQLCSLVIDNGSCTNVIFVESAGKLGFKIEPHPNLYYVTWVTNTFLKVQDRCLVSYSMGEIVDIVTCDVLPLKVCHILLGRLRLLHKKITHDG